MVSVAAADDVTAVTAESEAIEKLTLRQLRLMKSQSYLLLLKSPLGL